MATNRILEFTPSQEEAIVARILVLLHQAVDEHFPSAEKATRQFTKTVFSEEGERTALGAPTEGQGFGNEEKTGPGERPPDPNVAHCPVIPPPPRDTPVSQAAHAAAAQSSARTPPLPGHAPQPQPANSGAPHSRVPPSGGMPSASGASAASAFSGMSGISGIEKKRPRGDAGPDWITRATLALLVAGLILLAYSFLA